MDCCTEGAWDKMLGVDPDYDLRDMEDEEAVAGSSGGAESDATSASASSASAAARKKAVGVVEAARRARMRQLRRERLPEAALLPIGHWRKERSAHDLPYNAAPWLEGKLVVQGDPSMFLML